MVKQTKKGGENLTFRELLKECDTNCSRLSRQLGVSRELVRRWANGKSTPTTLVLIEISKILDKPIQVVAKTFTVTKENKKGA